MNLTFRSISSGPLITVKISAIDIMVIMDRRLLEAASKLHVSDEDMKAIRNSAERERVFRETILPILIMIISALTYVAGFSLGYRSSTGYPFLLVVDPTLARRRKKRLMYGLIPIATFVAGFLVGRVGFPGNTTWYNVYKRSGFEN